MYRGGRSKFRLVRRVASCSMRAEPGNACTCACASFSFLLYAAGAAAEGGGGQGGDCPTIFQ